MNQQTTHNRYEQANINNINQTHQQQHNKLLKICHWNCNGLNSKIKQLQLFLSSSEPDIVCLNEIKTHDENANNLLNDLKRLKPSLGYNSIYNCRTNGLGGGAAIIIKNTIDFQTIPPPAFPTDIEIVGAEIRLLNTKLSVYSYYNSPTTPLSGSILRWINRNSNNYIICGDLNAKHQLLNCHHTNNSGETLIDFLESSSAIIINNHLGPTYVQKHRNYSERLDVIITSPRVASKLVDVNLLTNGDLDSDHFPILAGFSLYKPVATTQKSAQPNKVLYNKADWPKFQQLLSSSCSNIPLDLVDDINSLNCSLVESMVVSAAAAIPNSRSSFGNNDLPAEIIDIIKLKRKAMRVWYNNRTELNLIKYKTLNNQVKLLIKNQKDNDWDKFIKTQGPNPTSSKPFWQRINKFRNKPESNEICHITENGITYKTDQQKADVFANHLGSIFSNTNDPRFNDHFKQQIEEEVSNFNFNNYDFNNHLITINEINTELHRLNNKTTIDPQGISNRLLKNTSTEFRARLLILFNSCLRSGTLPSAWKRSNVRMLKKKADSHSSVKNYRPISLTSCICKLYERIIQTRLATFLKENNVITNVQSGFRKHRSTKDNIFFIVQKALETFNRNKNGGKWKMVGIPFDIQSAFDKVWHNGIEYKLIKLKVPTYIINWIKQFLSDRMFKVIVNDTESELHPIQCGVPQGAVLSPLLFSIFINDIPDNTSTNRTYSFLFADDLIFIHIYYNDKRATKIVNDHLVEIEEWLDKWRLKMAVHKCNQIIFNNLKSSPDDLDIKLYGDKINREKEITFLGMVLDEKLNFASHIAAVKKKAISRLNIIKTVSHKSWKLSKPTLINLYTSLIRSIFEYSAIVAPRLSSQLINQLQVIQNNALRSILHLHFNKTTKKHTSITELHRLAGIPMINTRLATLRNDYLDRAILLDNPIITRSIDEFKNFVGGRVVETPTLLDEYIHLLEFS
jgi:exonuclease III